MTSSEKGGNALEVAKTVYTSLRIEIVEKMKFSNQLLGYKLVSLGGIIGFIASNLNRDKNSTDLNSFLIAGILVGAGLAFSFDLALYQNNKAIIAVGTYMKEHLEPLLKSISGDQKLTMWEEFIAPKEGRAGKRMTYNIFEAVNYLMTLLLMFFAAVALWSSRPLLVTLLFPWLLGEVLIAIKGLSR